MRVLYRERRDAALAAVRAHLPPEVRLGPLLGGTHGCLHLPPGCDDQALVQRLADDGFGIEMVSTYSWPQAGSSGLVFGYGADDPPRLDAGMKRLGVHLRSAIAAAPRGGTAVATPARRMRGARGLAPPNPAPSVALRRA